ncbi:histidine phosphatase family protein [Salimicrobium humidisoli]|uniref:Histidine phosphatase family protein n=1 Tax=Salimicrobium humidisoli TaxID=2029857 RepID=A0ABX4HRZ4_9BACI|nr:histidine phosphatase family protein [Salimicrobium humidisoli]PBB05991.1 histidine phosphatase family protein [Salimicrobium humidisoli]
MTSICLVRHGETMWNREKKLQGGTDIPLNDKGVSQAELCRDYLKDDAWDVLVTSPLERAKHTAEIIGEGHNLPLIVMEEFRERHFGEAEGMPEEERLAAYPDKQYPGQEDKEVFINRVMTGVRHLVEEFPDRRVLLVAHGAVINAILTEISDGEIGADRFKLLNGCLTNIEFMEGIWKVHDYNQVTHLS